MERYKSKLFKLIPLYEGKVKGCDLYLDTETAFEQYMAHLGICIIEFSGFDEEPYDDIVHNLKGLKSVGKDVTHAQVRSIVLNCISMLERC